MSERLTGWEVAAPEAGRRPARLRRSTLRLTTERGSEELRVPVAVGRRLSAADAAPATRSELLAILDECALSCARARIAELLGRRDYTSLEVSQRLREEGYRDSVAGEALAWARECGLVDDARYGAAFARSKVLSGWGRLRVERELERRGVDPGAIAGWPEEFTDGEDERSRALALASRRRLTGRNDYQKVARFLVGRGFSYGVASDVAREVVGSAD